MATVIAPSDSNQSKTIIKLTEADSPYTLDRKLCPCLITNGGASDAVTVVLPADFKGGEVVEAMVLAAQDIILDPGLATQFIQGDDGTNVAAAFAAGKAVIGDALGEKITLTGFTPGTAGVWLATQQALNDGSGVFNEEQG